VRVNNGNRAIFSVTPCANGNNVSRYYDIIRDKTYCHAPGHNVLVSSTNRTNIAATIRRCNRCNMVICTDCYNDYDVTNLSLSFLPCLYISTVDFSLLEAIIASLSLGLEVAFDVLIVFLQPLLSAYRTYK
jgi:hypothetical protein